jgi:eukaryotic-like serine/threonine-protein kinase
MSQPEEPESLTSLKGEESSSVSPRGALPPSPIGPYRLLRQIGEGGFGSVYAAEQEQPIRRIVALKILKSDRDSREVVARFEQERQALALMDHPNIAKVLDAGTTTTGRPYFVMELVKGERITEYCDTHNLTIAERLAVFVQVCHAVQHAHQKGVIHRDIKPSNVLVTTRDDAPHVIVIDFGVAKAASPSISPASVFTEHRQMIGTLEYMSPEQAEGSLDIDTRTDVYSLGILLYELLTGTTPVSSRELRSAALGEVLRILREVEPPLPSSRVSGNSQQMSDIASHRRLHPKKLPSVIRGELDWIVMRAIEKDRRRRYETASGLASDIHRYLAGEPVVAAPPSAAYRLRKLVQRHTAAVVAAGLIAVTLLLGIAGTTAGMVQAKRERHLAEAAGDREAVERRKSEAINDFLRSVLISADPNQGGRQAMSVGEAMANAVNQLDRGAFSGEPEVELELRLTIAKILSGNARGDEALPNAEKAIMIARRVHGDSHERVAASLVILAQVHNSVARHELAEQHAREALDVYRRVSPEGDLGTAVALKAVAGALANQQKNDEAEPFFREALTLRRRLITSDDRDLAQSLNDYGFVMMRLGKKEEAEPLFAEAMSMRQRLFRGDHPHLAEALNNLAWSQERAHRLREAEENYRKALDMYQRLFTGEHLLVSRGLYHLGWNLLVQRRYGDAEPVLANAAAAARRLYDRPTTALSERLALRAACLMMLGKEAEAAPLWEEAQKVERDARNGAPSAVAATYLTSVVSHMFPVDSEGAVSLATALKKRAERSVPAGSPEMASELELYGATMLRVETAEAAREAESALRDVMTIRLRSTYDERVAYYQSLLGDAILRASLGPDGRPVAPAGGARLAEAETLMTAGLSALTAGQQKIPPAQRQTILADANERLARLYEAWLVVDPAGGYEQKAATHRREAARIRDGG